MEITYDCKKTSDFLHEFRRMCNTFHDCEGCLLQDNCLDSFSLSDEDIAIVQAWSDTHPEIVKLTKRERQFLECFTDIDGKSITRTLNGDLLLRIIGNSIPIDNQMFLFIRPGNCITFQDLMETEVEDGE